MESTITLIGNATNDAELRHTNAGTPIAGFTVASTPRIYDKHTGTWRDGESTFLRVNAWRGLAENASDSRKGTRVIVTGRLRMAIYTGEDGSTHTAIEVEADEIGLSLRWTPAAPTRTGRTRRPDSADDPWATDTDAAPTPDA